MGDQGAPPPEVKGAARPWRNWPFRGVTLHAVYCFSKRRSGRYNDVIILTRCQSLTISDIRPSALKFHMAHGKACRSRALQLECNMAVQYLQPPLAMISSFRFPFGY